MLSTEIHVEIQIHLFSSLCCSVLCCADKQHEHTQDDIHVYLLKNNRKTSAILFSWKRMQNYKYQIQSKCMCATDICACSSFATKKWGLLLLVLASIRPTANIHLYPHTLESWTSIKKTHTHQHIYAHTQQQTLGTENFNAFFSFGSSFFSKKNIKNSLYKQFDRFFSCSRTYSFVSLHNTLLFIIFFSYLNCIIFFYMYCVSLYLFVIWC